MTTVTETAPVTSSRVDWAPVPRVNLLPPEISEARHLAKVQRILAAAVAGTLLVAGGASWVARSGVGTAQEDLDTVRAANQALVAEEAKYSHVPALIAEVEAVEAARTQAMTGDVLWHRFLEDVATSTPSGVYLTNLSLAMAATPGSTGATPSGSGDLLTPGITTVTVTGKAKGFSTVSAWLDGLDRVAGLDGSFVSNVARDTSDPTLIQFSSGATFTQAGLSHRYDRKAG